MDDAPRAIQQASSLCTSCPKLCRFSCPVAVADGRESSTPTAKMTRAHRLAAKTLELTPAAAEPIFRCTGCRIQTGYCKHDIDAADTLEATRSLAYAAGALPPALAAKESRLRVDRDPVRSDLLERVTSFGPAPADADRLLAGCRSLRDDPQGIRVALSLLERRRPTGVWDREPVCCGYPLYVLGDRKALTAQARAFAKAARGVRTVVLDPGCAFLIRRVYPELGVRLKSELSTLPEALDEMRETLGAPSVEPEKVAYHDPCHLGRRLGIHEEPRRLLRWAGAEVVAGADPGTDEGCSGFGGGYPLLDPQGARRIAERRAAELAASGAQRIVTACASCQTGLSAASPIPVTGLADYLSERLPGD